MLKHLVIILMGFITGPALADIQLNQPAPDFQAIDTNGKSVSLSALKGKNIVLEWTNHQCPFVVKHYESGNIPSTQKHAIKAGAVWISIISSAPGKQGHVSAEEANRIAAEKGAVPSHIILDETGKIGRSFGAKTTPHLFVINAEGNVVYAGAIDNKASPNQNDISTATSYVTTALAALGEGKLPDEQTSQPYGCSVKY